MSDSYVALVQAPSHWHAVDFVSDLHLQGDDAVWQAFSQYLAQTPADAVFLLGDIFELWAGDDILDSVEHGAFERLVVEHLRQASQRTALYLMHGNRDFLIGTQFAQKAGLQLLADPCVLQWHTGERTLLSHGDALCIDDEQYQQARAQFRHPAFLQQVLGQPLTARLTLAQQLRQQSAARKNALGVEGYADVDTPMARHWLHTHSAKLLVHGHTHKPDSHDLGDGLHRLVLPDWDSHSQPQRGGVMRYTPTAKQPWERLPIQFLLQ